MVSIVPTSEGSDSSAILAENCAESATTVIPHTTHRATRTAGLPPYRNPARIEHVPLRIIAVIATVVRPHRSASQPAITHPTAPLPMVENVANFDNVNAESASIES